MRLRTAHHDDVVAMHAADDARALVAGLIMAPTVGRQPSSY
jgi:hypothetical protein